MNNNVKTWLLKQSWRDIQKKIKRQNTKTKNNWLIRTLMYALVAVALLFLILPSTSNHLVEKYTGIEVPPVLKQSEKAIYAPGIYDPIEAAKLNQRRSGPIGADPRFGKLQLISFVDQKHIPPGAEVPAKLSSGGTNGLIKSELIQDLNFDGTIYLPRKTILIGHGTSSDERLFINFSKAILPSGKAIKIAAQGFDGKDRLVGLKGKKVSDFAFKIAASSGLIFLGAMAENLKSNDGSSVFQQRKKSLHDAALDGVTTSTAEQGKRFIDSMDNHNRIEVGFDSQLIVIFDEVENDK